MKNIDYLNVGYFTKLRNKSFQFDQQVSLDIKEYIKCHIVTKKETIFFIDFEDISFLPSQDIDISLSKKSPLYFAFFDMFKDAPSAIFVFFNCDIYIGKYLITKDFPEAKNICVFGSKSEYFQLFSVPNLKARFFKHEIFLKSKLNINVEYDFSTYDNISALKENLISYKVKSFLLQKNEEGYLCISPVTKENHILKSTPVHVNKYINIKPLIENYVSFSLICYLISERIRSKMNIPDFIVATSKNSFALAAGVLFFLPSELLIINQISPITSFDNFSTLGKISSKARYAVIEDFSCMGTEIKIVKSILWSHGVNFEENVYFFPLASTRLLDYDKIDMTDQKIFPLYKLEEEFHYKVFTHNSCPVCNNIQCAHRDLFNI